MAAYKQKDGDISIFLVREKKNERGPDYTGKALIDGKEKDVSLWIKSPTMFAGTIKDKFKPPFKKLHDDIADQHNRPLDDEMPPF